MSKCMLLAMAFVTSLPAQSGRFQMPAGGRQKINIDFDWKFIDRDFPHEEETHQVNQLPWQPVQLPHDASIGGPFSPDHNTTQGFLPMVIGWYNKGLHFPESYRDKKIFICFDGVYRSADVWMNYAFLGHHESGYTGFTYDLTDYVRLGDRTPNGLRVRVDGRRHEQDMYEGTGIYRHVWLLITDPIHVTCNGTFVSAFDINRAGAGIRALTRIKNDHATNRPVRLETVLVDAAGLVVCRMVSRRNLAAGEEFEFEQMGQIKNPHLWDIDDPYLYQACSIVYQDDIVVDTYQTSFGVRSFYFTADKGFFLNGRSVKLKGFNAHHDYAGLGTALPDRMHWNAMLAMKNAGFNLFRSSHNPATPERLDVCDRIGMLVWDEIERKLESPEVELPLVRETILRDRNHPSIILWSLENESPLESTIYGTRIIKEATALAHQLDPTRLTTAAASMPVNRNGYGEALDVVSYNYDWRRADQDHRDFPHWKIGLMSEYSAQRARRGVYGLERFARAEEDSYFDLYDGLVQNMFELCTAVEESWQRIMDRPYIAGGCVWSGLDYWGEGNAWPLVSRGDGALDMCLIPKDVYYYFISQYTRKPMLHLFPHWNWAGQEGKPVEVWCYSTCDSVELRLNDKSLGVKSLVSVQAKDEKNSSRAGHLSWLVPYQPGILHARGMKAGETVCRQEIRTAGAPAKIRLTHVMSALLEEKQIQPLLADGRDVALVQAAIVDKNGVVVPDATHHLQFSVEGGENIIGVGNGDIASHEPNKGSFRKAYNGYGVAVVQTTTRPNTFSVVATSPGLESGRLVLSSVAPQTVQISLTAKTVRPSDSGELVITAELCDRYGCRIPSAESMLTLALTGSARFASGEKTTVVTAGQGRAEVSIRCEKRNTPLRITASAAGVISSRMDFVAGP